MIDVAFTDQANEKLIPWLKSKGVSQIDEIFITHPHEDHYGGLWALVNSDFPVKKIWMNIPNKEICDKEIPWGCNYKEIQELIAAIKGKGINVSPLILNDVNKSKILHQDTNSKLELLYTSSPINPVLGPMDINDLSMIMKLQTNGISYLFTGDLNTQLSNYLAENEENLKVDIFKVPHHGTESVASNEFLDKVQPAIAIVPSPQDLWCSKRSDRYREYFKSKQVQTYVMGFAGDITIHHFDNAPLVFDVQHPNAKVCQ
jgi:competence protein ComEC